MISLPGVITYPIPAYQNVPINAQFYVPNRFVISNVGLGFTTTVTTTIPHNYVIGQQVRVIIPPSFGCRQLNESFGYVIQIPSIDQVVIDIDSSKNVDPYINSQATTVAQILAIGDVNSGVVNALGTRHIGTFIPGSFIDISPL